MSPRHRNKQSGAALVFSLIILLILTLLGITSMDNASLEEKMANNMRDLNLAFEAAEAGLREAETWLNNQTSPENVNAQAFVYQPGELANALDENQGDISKQSHTWWQNNNHAGVYGLAGSSDLAGVNAQPRFVIEYRGAVKDSVETDDQGYIHYYRITSRGTGATDTAQSITQNTFARRFN